MRNLEELKEYAGRNVDKITIYRRNTRKNGGIIETVLENDNSLRITDEGWLTCSSMKNGKLYYDKYNSCYYYAKSGNQYIIKAAKCDIVGFSNLVINERRG